MVVGELEKFLAHAIELESEALERYEELSGAMRAHHNKEVARFFARMVQESRLHCKVVTALAAELSLPDLKAWEFEWPGVQAPESSDYEAVHYRMGEREAVQLALANERAAQDFYEAWVESSEDERTRELAVQLAAEEADHARQLEELLETLAEAPKHQRQDDDEPHMPE